MSAVLCTYTHVPVIDVEIDQNLNNMDLPCDEHKGGRIAKIKYTVRMHRVYHGGRMYGLQNAANKETLKTNTLKDIL